MGFAGKTRQRTSGSKVHRLGGIRKADFFQISDFSVDTGSAAFTMELFQSLHVSPLPIRAPDQQARFDPVRVAA
jgi:hypothetical protein